jgi:hypothetical protein
MRLVTLLSAALLAVLAAAPADAQDALAAARAQAVATVTEMTAAARVDARRAIGDAPSTRAARAERMIATPSTATADDLAALTAEAAARGRGETAAQVADRFAARHRAYVAALAAIDGRRDDALARIAAMTATGALTDIYADLRTGVAAALASIPPAIAP